MSRLCDRLAAAVGSRDLGAMDAEELSSLERARGKVVRADEIAEYMRGLSGSKGWDLFGDFPRVVPPFDRTFIEFRHREGGRVWVFGVLFEREDFFHGVPFEEALQKAGEERPSTRSSAGRGRASLGASRRSRTWSGSPQPVVRPPSRRRSRAPSGAGPPETAPRHSDSGGATRR